MGLPDVPYVPTAVLKVAVSWLLLVPVMAAVDPGTISPIQLDVVFQLASVAPVLSHVPFAASAEGMRARERQRNTKQAIKPESRGVEGDGVFMSVWGDLGGKPNFTWEFRRGRIRRRRGKND